MNHDRIFAGIFPGGISYADRKREVNGDYKRLAFLPYDTLELEIAKDCPKALAAEIRQDAAQYKAGDELSLSSSQNLTVVLGRNIKKG